MPRIVTLLPSATEIVAALGFESSIVGRSHECDYPADVAALPALTEPKFNAEGGSAEIDRSVKRVVADALSVYRVDAARLRELNPDVIVTQSQCEVCAVSQRDVEDAVAEWVGRRPQIVALAPFSLDDVFEDMARVADAIGAHQAGRSLVSRLRERIGAIRDSSRRADRRPTVATIEWIDPLMAGGNWMPTLVETAGGRNLFGKAGEHSPWLEFSDLEAADPDAIIIAPCGFGIERTITEMPALSGRPGWNSMGAVRGRSVIVADGNQYFNRPGPRIVESAEILAEFLHPEIFNFGHEGIGWRRL